MQYRGRSRVDPAGEKESHFIAGSRGSRHGPPGRRRFGEPPDYGRRFARSVWPCPLRQSGTRVIVIAEELVPTEYIQRYPEQTIIPAHRVEAIIHQPFGAHPSAVFQCYDYDSDHLKLYVNHSKSIERFPEYVNTYILGTKDHWEYLEKVGGLRRMNELKEIGRAH